MKTKFRKNPVFKDKYVRFMREYEQLGHISPWPNAKSLSKNTYFLPHHGALKGEKLRTVFNGSAKINGVSLNDLLLPGPRLVQDLFDVIVRWRRYKFVFITDIEKMSRQIFVNAEDRHCQVILWRENESDDIQIFVLNTVTYGLTSSPYLASKAVRQLAEDKCKSFSLAVLIILEWNEVFVDDFTSGEDSVEEAKARQLQLL